MPVSKNIGKTRNGKRRGKSASAQAREFLKAVIDMIRQGTHDALSHRQAIAIGLSQARRAGVDLPASRKGKTKRSTRKSAKYAYEAGQHRRKATRRPKASGAMSDVLKHEPRRSASHKALSRHSGMASRRRSAASRSRAARKAARTKGAAGRSAAAKKAARTRARRRT
jgi:hypothetical protein